jgi:hypothetical protein
MPGMHPYARPLAVVALALPAALSCNSVPSGTIQLVTGGETDTFTQSPVPTKIKVVANDGSQTPPTLATASYPTDSIDLGNVDQNAVAAIAVYGLDGSGKTLIYGESVVLQYGALDGATLPIFVQRVGQNARLPSPLGDSRQAPTLGILSDRFLIVGGGADSSIGTTTNVYDFAQFATLASPPSLPHIPTSMPIVGTMAIVIDTAGAASYDFSQTQPGATELVAPTNAAFSFADVAGGQTIYDTTDSSSTIYVVGATRTTGSPTAAVLQIQPNDASNPAYPFGNMTWLTLSSARLGASAAWHSARGLVVAGGSPTAAGVEIIAPQGTGGSPLPFPSDASSGAAMTQLDGTHLLVAGGVLPDGSDAGVRALDLGCAQGCGSAPGTQTWGSPLATPLTNAFVADYDPARALLVGSEPRSGLTHVFLLTTAAATEIPTKVAHTNARAISSPVGTVLIVGGATEIESFVPATP